MKYIVLLVVGISLLSRVAKAADSSPPRPAQDAIFRRVAVTVDPLALAAGSVWARVSVLPARHHAIAMSGFVAAPIGLNYEGRVSGAGGDLGYRFYSGSRGPNGIFVGPSVTFYRGDAGYTALALGGRLEAGAQHIFDNGLTLGAGAGVTVAAIQEQGWGPGFGRLEIAPHLLTTVGWSF